MKALHRHDAEDDERDHHNDLRGNERSFALSRCQPLQGRYFLECLHHADEDIQVQRNRRGRDCRKPDRDGDGGRRCASPLHILTKRGHNGSMMSI